MVLMAPSFMGVLPLWWDWADGCGAVVLLLDDNPAFEGLFEFCSISAGGSIGEYFTFFSLGFYRALVWRNPSRAGSGTTTTALSVGSHYV